MPLRWFVELEESVVINTLCVSRDATDPAWATIPATMIPTETEVPIGSTYANGVFTPPVPPAAPRLLTKFAFLRLLTPVEYAAMFTQTDAQLVYGVACFDAAADPFDIDNPLVGQMLDYCVAVGALTQARRDALWTAMQSAV
jgi:hypothetical protein